MGLLCVSIGDIMSSNRIQYRIYANDQTHHTSEEWSAADRYINGLAYTYDKKEAFAIAKRAARNCSFPFVVMAVPLPNRAKDKLCAAWIVDA
jgi:hypothetical protein